MPISVILGIAAAALVVVIVVKFGKAILKLTLVLAVGGGWLVLRSGAPNGLSADGGALGDLAAIAQALRPAPRPAPSSSARGFTGGLCVGAALVLVLLALGVAGYFYVRWKLEARKPGRRQGEGGWVSGPNAFWGRQRERQGSPPPSPQPPTYHPPAYPRPAQPPWPPAYPSPYGSEQMQGYPPVVVISEPAEPNEAPLDMLPLWDDEGEW